MRSGLVAEAPQASPRLASGCALFLGESLHPLSERNLMKPGHIAPAVLAGSSRSSPRTRTCRTVAGCNAGVCFSWRFAWAIEPLAFTRRPRPEDFSRWPWEKKVDSPALQPTTDIRVGACGCEAISMRRASVMTAATRCDIRRTGPPWWWRRFIRWEIPASRSAWRRSRFADAVWRRQPPFDQVDFEGSRPTLERFWRAVATAQTWCT